jgi:hypothetical protein
VDLATYLRHHRMSFEAVVLAASKKVRLEYDDAIQIALIEINEILPKLRTNLEGDLQLVRDLKSGLYFPVDPSSKSVGRYVAKAAYNAVLASPEASVSRLDKSTVSMRWDEIPSPQDMESELITEDLLRKAMRFAQRKGDQYVGLTRDLFASVDMGEYANVKEEAWRGYCREKGFSEGRPITLDYIYRSSGLSIQRCRSFISRLKNYMATVGLRPLKERS